MLVRMKLMEILISVNPLYMGNFRVSGDKVGSIIWRKNIYFNSDCAKIGSKIGAIRSYLPNNAKGSGGIWMQPISFPPKPSFKSTKGNINLDSIFCHKKINQVAKYSLLNK